MVKVYLATSGEYSDYRVCHAFAREEDARSYHLGDDVAELEVHEGPVEVRMWHRVTWWFGRAEREADSLHLSNPYKVSEPRDFDEALPGAFHHWHSDSLVVDGWDLDRVMKVFSEQRAKHLAEAAQL